MRAGAGTLASRPPARPAAGDTVRARADPFRLPALLTVDLVLWRNPVAFYSLSGRLDLCLTATGPTHQGNSVLRGTPARPIPAGR